MSYITLHYTIFSSTVSPAEFGQLVAGSKLPEMKGQPMRLPDKWREKWMTKVKEIGKDKVSLYYVKMFKGRHQNSPQ